MKRLGILAVLVFAGCLGGASASTGPVVTPVPIGQGVFGTAIDISTMTVTTPLPASGIASTASLGWVAYLNGSISGTSITVTVASVGYAGAETAVSSQTVPVADPTYTALAHTPDSVAATLGVGTFAIRYIRPADGKILAQGKVTIKP